MSTCHLLIVVLSLLLVGFALLAAFLGYRSQRLAQLHRQKTLKISRRHQKMMRGVLDLNNLSVDDVMVPRHEMKGIDIEQPLEKIMMQMGHCQDEWILFYRESMNQVIGILPRRDILQALLTHKTIDKNLLQHLFQEPHFVPQGTSLNIQLAYFQQSHDKIAFVVNEYGDLQGSLTMNDILEEIIGDFSVDMTQKKRIELQLDGSYAVDGTVTLREFNRATEWALPVSGPKTISGLIVEYLEALPHSGTAVRIGHYPMEIVQVKGNRIKLARIFPPLSQE